MKKPAITISQSFIKMFIRNFNDIDDENICPRKIYALYVLKQRTESTLQNLRGLYFEDLCCDTNNNAVSLPGDARTGKKTLITKRIEQQAHIFKEWLRDRQGIVNEVNSQIKIYKRWEHDKNVILSGLLDVFPVGLTDEEEGGYLLSIIDIKLTADLKNNYGKFCWGNISRMDHLQAIMYHYLVRDIDYELNDELNPGNNLRELTQDIRDYLDAGLCQFRYYVADIKSNFSSDVFKYVLKPDDFHQLHEAIRKVVYRTREYNDAGWPANPSSDLCLGNPQENIYKCPFEGCSRRKKEREI